MATPLQFTTQARGPGFVSGQGARRFILSHQTIGTAVTAQTSFAATTPTFMFRKTSSQTTNRLIISSMTLSQTGTVAGGEIFIKAALDTTDRFSSGGTAVLPQLTTAQQVASAVIPGFTFLYNPTATAAGTVDSIPRYTSLGSWPPVTGTTLPTFDFEDEFVVKGPGAFLIYVYSAVTGASLNFSFDCYEDDVHGDM